MLEEAPEPTLPPLPPGEPTAARGRRKRSRHVEAAPPDSSTSSDPAWFSSDDDPALDNYQGNGRRKRRYKGTWFDQHPASCDSAFGDESDITYRPPRRQHAGDPSQPTEKRQLKRQIDSGVWLNEDSSLTDSDESIDLAPLPAKLTLGPIGPVTLLPPRPFLSEVEQAAQKIIQACVEDGTESVDLSGLGLERVSPGVLEPIGDITPIPNVTKDVAFEQRDPEIRLFMGNNALTAFPPALLNLEYLTVLSLRGNQLSTLPPSLLRLKNLQTLNIAQNKLRHLPGEWLNCLDKGSKLRYFHVHPNPFWRPQPFVPDFAAAAQYQELTLGVDAVRDDGQVVSTVGTKLYARTPVQFMDITASAHTSFELPPTSCNDPKRTTLPIEPFHELETPMALDRELRYRAATSKIVNPQGPKSLLELALKKCAEKQNADETLAIMRQSSDVWPPHLLRLLEQAVEIRENGGLRCSVCGRETIIPLAQWVEFREIGQMIMIADGEGDGEMLFAGDRDSEGPVPFLMIGCSWKCIPKKVEKKRLVEEEVI